MKENASHWRKKAAQWCRLGVQIVAMGFTVVGYNRLVDLYAVPPVVFLGTIVLAGMFFCGWMCPFGSAQEWLRLAGRKLTCVSIDIPNPLHRYLSLSRYILLALFISMAWNIFTSPTNSRVAFLSLFLGRAAAWPALIIMGIMLILSLFIDRPYCKYVCGRGAQYGLWGLLRPFTVKRDAEKCIGCGKCDKLCPMGIEVSTAGNLRTASCVNCFRCMSDCPTAGALKFGFAVPKLKDLKEAVRRYFSLNPRNE